MKVTHVITGLNDGGAEAVLYRLCVYDEGIEHIVISMMGMGKYGKRLVEHGVEVHCLDMPKGMLTYSGIKKLYMLIKKIEPDLVQTWMYHADLVGGVLAKLCGVKNIVWGVRHANLKPGTVKRSTILVAKFCGFLSRFIPNKIISCSVAAVNSHVELGYVKSKFVVIPNGYSLEEFKPQVSKLSFLDKLNLTNGPLVGMVGRYDVQKDHGNLLSALSIVKKSYPDIRCLLVGTGMEFENSALMNLIDEADCLEQVILLGRREDIPAIMSRLDFHILSSLGEAFPNVLAEAMASGTPCVTTDVGDASLIVGHTGWIVPPENPEALASAMKEALVELTSDNIAWKARKVQSRERIQNEFQVKMMVDRFADVWEDEYSK